MRGVPKQKMLSNISKEARVTLKTCEKSHSVYFDQSYLIDDRRIQILSNINENILSMRKSINRSKEVIKKYNAYLHETIRKLEEQEKKLSLMVDTADKLETIKTYDPCLSYLNTLQLHLLAQNDINAEMKNIDDLYQGLSMIQNKFEN